VSGVTERTDEELLNFDREGIEDWDEAGAMVLFVEQPDLYRNHLAVALYLDGWAAKVEEHERASSSAQFSRGYVEALRQLAAYLRKGALLPGGEQLDPE
jgi:hypothetical protein